MVNIIELGNIHNNALNDFIYALEEISYDLSKHVMGDIKEELTFEAVDKKIKIIVSICDIGDKNEENNDPE